MGNKYSPQCPSGKPHYRICGDNTIRERLPEFFQTHPEAPRGCEWQVCLYCGDAFYSSLDPEDGQIIRYTDPVNLRTGPEYKDPGSFNIENHPRPPAHDCPGYVTTGVAAARLLVGRSTVREYILSGRLEGKRWTTSYNCSIWLVSIASLSRLLGERFGEAITAGIVDGLLALDRQAFGELSVAAQQAQDGQGGNNG